MSGALKCWKNRNGHNMEREQFCVYVPDLFQAAVLNLVSFIPLIP